MLIGRFLMIVPVLALAGSLAGKKILPPSEASFPGRRPDLRPRPGRDGPDRRGADLSAGPGPRSHRRAFPHDRIGGPVLSEDDRALANPLPFRPGHHRPGGARRVQKAQSAPPAQEPGHIRHRGRGAADDGRPVFEIEGRAGRLRAPGVPLALVHGALRQFRRGHGRRPGQGPGRRTPKDTDPH